MIEVKEGIDAGEVGAQYWTRGLSYSTNEGDKIFFTCRKYQKCPKRLELLLQTSSQDVCNGFCSIVFNFQLFQYFNNKI